MAHSIATGRLAVRCDQIVRPDRSSDSVSERLSMDGWGPDHEKSAGTQIGRGLGRRADGDHYRPASVLWLGDEAGPDWSAGREPALSHNGVQSVHFIDLARLARFRAVYQSFPRSHRTQRGAGLCDFPLWRG